MDHVRSLECYLKFKLSHQRDLTKKAELLNGRCWKGDWQSLEAGTAAGALL